MKNITLSADESQIESARQRAKAENSTLNEQFRRWLADYVRDQHVDRYEETMSGLRGKVVVGRKLTRDQRNER